MDYKVRQMNKKVQKAWSRNTWEMQEVRRFPYYVVTFSMIALLITFYLIRGPTQVISRSRSSHHHMEFPKAYLDRISKFIKSPHHGSYEIHMKKTDKEKIMHAVVLQALNNTYDGFYVQYGFCDKLRSTSTLMLERELGWTGLIIEPDPERYKDLIKRNRKTFMLNACLPTHLGQEPGQMKMSRKDLGGIDHLLDMTLPNEFEVECFPLYDILTALGKRDSLIDFFQVDANGDEFLVMSVIPWNSLRIKVVAVHIPVEQKSKMDSFMKFHHFKFIASAEQEGRDGHQVFYSNNKFDYHYGNS